VSDIFVSYASSDRPRIKPLVDALTQRGWSVWWDRTILAGKAFDRVIEAALKNSRCVVVLWSRASIDSDWVWTEADEGKRRKVLVPAILDDIDIPLAFRRIQAANLIGWSGESPSEQFDQLARAISEVLSSKDSWPPEVRSAEETRESGEQPQRIWDNKREEPVQVEQERLQRGKQAPAKRARPEREKMAQYKAEQERFQLDALKAHMQFQADLANEIVTAHHWFKRGVAATDLDDKIRFYSEAIRHKPGYASAFLNRAVALRAKGEEKEAIQDYNTAIRLDANLAGQPCTEELPEVMEEMRRQMLETVAKNLRM